MYNIIDILDENYGYNRKLTGDVVYVDITEDQIRSMFGKLKEFVLTINLPECKKFISQYIKEVIVYKGHVWSFLFMIIVLLAI